RCAGSRRLYVPLPRFADSPGDRVLSPAARAHVVCMCLSPGSRTHRGVEFCRPLRGLTSFVCASPPVRGLTGGYGSVARCAGSRRCASPPVRGLTGGYVVSPAARADVVCMCLCPRFEDSPGATVLSPASRARGSTQNSELRTSSGRGAQLLQQLKCFVRNETPKARAKQ